MMARILKKSEFAARYGIAKAQVTIICRQDNFKNAVTPDGRIDCDHPDAIRYLENRLAKQQQRNATPEPEQPADTIPHDMMELANLPFERVVELFKSDERMGKWLKNMKTMEDIHRMRLDNAVKEGTLVTRELVQRGVISEIEQMTSRLLHDGARTISREVIAQHLAGADEPEIVKKVRVQITSFVRGCKTKIRRNMKHDV
jgi:hypothetical protein